MSNKAGSTKFWLGVVNPGAEVYESVDKVLKEMQGASFKAWIWHDQDIEEDGTLKNRHCHFVLVMASAMTFEEMQKALPGAHIEKGASLPGAVAYLTHETQQAKTEGKHLYARSKVITNNLANYNAQANEGAVEVFDPWKVEEYLERGITNQVLFFKAFGFNTLQYSWRTYEALINDLMKQSQRQELLTAYQVAVNKAQYILTKKEYEIHERHEKVLKLFDELTKK